MYILKYMNSHRKRYLKIRTCVQNSRAVSTSVHIMHINSLWQLPCLPVCLPVLSSKKDGNCNLRCHKSHRRRLNHPSFVLKEKKNVTKKASMNLTKFALQALMACRLKVAQTNYVSRNQLHCTANLNFGLMCKRAKHCWALPTNFSFQFS